MAALDDAARELLACLRSGKPYDPSLLDNLQAALGEKSPQKKPPRKRPNRNGDDDD